MLKFDLSGNIPIESSVIKKCFQCFSRAAKIGGNRSVSLAFIDGKAMRRINRQYRGRDRVTDVLSFAERDAAEVWPGEKGDLGEILICTAQAERQAKEFRRTLTEEICRLLVHGLAHLIGHEHEGVSEATAKKMKNFESQVLSRIISVQ